MWLRDLLGKDIEKARVTTFEYDSKWFDDPDHVTLRDCARRLLRCLVLDRSHGRQSRMCSTRVTQISFLFFIMLLIIYFLKEKASSDIHRP